MIIKLSIIYEISSWRKPGAENMFEIFYYIKKKLCIYKIPNLLFGNKLMLRKLNEYLNKSHKSENNKTQKKKKQKNGS